MDTLLFMQIDGCLMLHEVKDGEFDLMQVSLDYLRRRYSK